MQSTSGSNDSWNVQPGNEVRRSELHDRFRGNRQRGISTCPTQIMLFSEAGEAHGYSDGPDESGNFYIYTGEGKNGDQTLTRGNKAVLEHSERRLPLRLFEGARGLVKYVGEFELVDYFWDEAAQSGSPGVRRVIKFRLRPKNPGSGS